MSSQQQRNSVSSPDEPSILVRWATQGHTHVLPLLVLLTALVVGSVSSGYASESASNREQAIQIATAKSGGGKVLSVKTINSKSDGSTVFAVKILKNGRVKVFRVPKLKQ